MLTTNIYISGIGLGTFIGNLVFIFGGRFIVDNLNANQDVLKLVIGSIFAITAFIMIWKMLTKKNNGIVIIIHTLISNPVIPFIGIKFPGSKIIFNIRIHSIPFLRRIAFFHN